MEEDRYVAEVGTNVVVSSSVKIPNNLKVRKKLDLWPIKLSAGLDYNFEKEEVTWVASCKVRGKRERERERERGVGDLRADPVPRSENLRSAGAGNALKGPDLGRQGDPGFEPQDGELQVRRFEWARREAVS